MIKATTNQIDSDLNTRSIKEGDTELIRSPSSRKPGQAPETPVTDKQDAEVSVQEPVALTRLDAITGHWTIFAPDRTQRPDEYRDVISSEAKTIACPFCGGNEAETPGPVWVGRELDLERLDDENEDYLVEADAKDWSVRVVPNKYPAVAHRTKVRHPRPLRKR